METTNRMRRIHTFQTNLEAAGLSAAVLILSRDVFYYTGTAQPGILLVTPDTCYLIVRRAMDFVRQETFLEKSRIIDGGGFKDACRVLKEMGVVKGRLGIEQDIIPAALYLKIKSIFSEFSLEDISGLIFNQRMQKDADEMEAIKQACCIMDIGHKRTLAVLKPGITELELAAEIECAHRKSGHEGVLSMRHFDFYISRGPLSAGNNLFKVSGFANTVTGVGLSAAVPAGPSYSAVRKGDLVITDIPTCYKGYHCDQTRTYAAGKPRAGAADLFRKLKEISDRTMETIKAGVFCGQVYDAAVRAASRLGVSEYFLGLPPRKAGFVGHGIGLDANEPPILSHGSEIVLKKDYVLTIEMHLTHPEYGVVKLEDMIRVVKNGFRLMSVTPRTLFAVDRHSRSSVC